MSGRIVGLFLLHVEECHSMMVRTCLYMPQAHMNSLEQMRTQKYHQLVYLELRFSTREYRTKLRIGPV